jgi:hypothetical protein
MKLKHSVGKGRGGGRGDRWPKYCMHIWIKEKKRNSSICVQGQILTENNIQ